MTQTVHAFILTQGIICAILNMILNPSIAWLANRQMNFVPLTGDNSMVIDTAITSIVMPFLVTLFTTSGVRKALRTGTIEAEPGYPRPDSFLSRLPTRAWTLGLLLGILSACITAPPTVVVFSNLGFTGLPFTWFAFFKAAYTGPLSFLLTRWVILRQLLHHRVEARAVV